MEQNINKLHQLWRASNVSFLFIYLDVFSWRPCLASKFSNFMRLCVFGKTCRWKAPKWASLQLNTYDQLYLWQWKRENMAYIHDLKCMHYQYDIYIYTEEYIYLYAMIVENGHHWSRLDTLIIMFQWQLRERGSGSIPPQLGCFRSHYAWLVVQQFWL